MATMTETVTEAPLKGLKAPLAKIAKRHMDEDVSRKGRAPSTWAYKKPSERTFLEHLCAIDLAPAEVYEDKPEDFIRGPVPTHPLWRENAFILSVGMAPVWVQVASYKIFPNLKWNIGFAYVFYLFAFFTYLIMNVKRLHRYMVSYGTFDENVRARDIVSDRQADKLAWTILTAVFIRTAGPFLLVYDKNVTPTLDLLSPVRLGWFLIAVDFFFYCYHRSCHEVPWLWFVHRTHHGTKHPTPLLTILADDYQDVLEIVLVPLAAAACVKLNFAEAWAAIYVEMLGHSGIRAYWPHPILTPFLKPLGMELAVEDHDLHHRYGRGGKNYGKQTRIFDSIFGTIAEREEGRQG